MSIKDCICFNYATSPRATGTNEKQVSQFLTLLSLDKTFKILLKKSFYNLLIFIPITFLLNFLGENFYDDKIEAINLQIK